ncbi:MAG: pyridoxal phosphate-dependent aminotransferase [Actinobacteria bacterium]|nr:pyridoxal phosphate-dependent aminotransferase [Actinomycetota bacterium]
MAGPNPHLTRRLQGFGTTIFAEMSALAARTQAVNLGQGFPDTDGPAEIIDVAVAAMRAGHNQYPPGPGLPELRQAVGRHQKRFYDLDYQPESEILVTVGATEAIAATMISLLEPGDEVITFEPWYDSYGASIAMAGGIKKVVTLSPPEYSFDPAELESSVTANTKLILLNTPHNPSGKVFSASEMNAIADIAKRHDLIVVTDEVYEHLVFEGEHIPMASLPGMWDRTVTISSGGKTFSFTGWKIGWVCAPAALVGAIRTAKQFLTFVHSGPFQLAIAAALDLDDSYYAEFVDDFRARRDLLCDGLAKAGFDVFAPQGTYFVNTDIRPLGATDGIDFCLTLPDRVGVVGIPTQVFYDNRERGKHLVRFTFCKTEAVLRDGIERLAKLND